MLFPVCAALNIKQKNTPAAPRVLIARYHLDFSLVCPVTGASVTLAVKNLSRAQLGSGVRCICTMQSHRLHLS